jgi:hypothetical protein
MTSKFLCAVAAMAIMFGATSCEKKYGPPKISTTEKIVLNYGSANFGGTDEATGLDRYYVMLGNASGNASQVGERRLHLELFMPAKEHKTSVDIGKYTLASTAGAYVLLQGEQSYFYYTVGEEGWYERITQGSLSFGRSGQSGYTASGKLFGERGGQFEFTFTGTLTFPTEPIQ